MRSDVNYSHSKNIGETIGEFCGLPIHSYDNFDLELDEALNTQRIVLGNQATGVESPSTADILPGEVLCSDNIIRRVTTAEAIGYDTYMEKRPVIMIIGTSDLAYDVENCQWERTDWKTGQSTPEELCAWLNAQPKCSFKYEVVTDGEDKILRATNTKGVLLYAFRYVGGSPGTYIGGGEIRPFEPPQVDQGANPEARVVECFVPAPEQPYREPIVLKEYEDEGVSKYIPTSHVERVTIGGTALFEGTKEN